MIYFNSDYLEGAHPAIMTRLMETNMVQTVGYGEDEYCEAAREKIKSACQAPEADVHFLVGGTQTNATVIDALLARHEGVLAAESAHINVHEAGAIEASGHKVLTLPAHDGKVLAADVEAYIRNFYRDETYEHMVAPGMLYISHPTELGTLYTLRELEDLIRVCREADIPLYMDGARLGWQPRERTLRWGTLPVCATCSTSVAPRLVPSSGRRWWLPVPNGCPISSPSSSSTVRFWPRDVCWASSSARSSPTASISASAPMPSVWL